MDGQAKGLCNLTSKMRQENVPANNHDSVTSHFHKELDPAYAQLNKNTIKIVVDILHQELKRQILCQ